jgi:hypothetical protein
MVRRTFLAVGFAVLVSMMLAPHGGKQGIEGWGPFFSAQGFHVTPGVIWYEDAGRVMIDMLALEMVFLAVLFAVVVNIHWARPKKKNRKPPSDSNSFAAAAPRSSPPSAPPPPRKETGPDSMKAVAKALDETDHQQGAANAEGKTTPGASTTTGTGKKSLWRLIGGCLLLAGASNSLRNLPPTFRSHDLDYKISYFVFGLLLAGIGAWLVVSYLSKRPRRALLILSVGWLLVVAAMVYTVQKSSESNKQFGNAMRGFANDWQRYVNVGGTGDFPTIKPTGNADTDLFGRCMNDFLREVGSFFDGMYKELDALGEKNVFETSVLTNNETLETEARKRIDGQRIIAAYRSNLPRSFDAWRQKLASYNLPNEQKKYAMNAFENVRPKFSHQYETLFNLLGNKEKAQFDFLSFMAGAFNEYKLNDGKISFNNATVRQRYHELTNDIEDTAKETAAFRKESLDNANVDLQKLSQ